MAMGYGLGPVKGSAPDDYGSRDFAARDPEGNRWSFGTYRGEPRRDGTAPT
jgi:uncharacterized glyoxalase superfamily protein PhnB